LNAQREIGEILRDQKCTFISAFVSVKHSFHPPFQGGGTGSNPVGGALEIWQQSFIYKDFRITGSDRQ
jgi:hypothetical protein